MAIELDREGNFQVEVTDYTLAQSETGSVNLMMKYRVLNAWDEESESWVDWTKDSEGNELEVTVSGMVNLIKKNDASGKSGGLNERQIDAVIEHCGWNGLMTAISSKEWKPTNCQVKVEKEDYKNKRYYRAAWINAFDSTPGETGPKPASPAVVQKLQDQWGAQLRALASKAKDKAQKPGGKPSLPPKAKAPEAATANAPGGDIPF